MDLIYFCRSIKFVPDAIVSVLVCILLLAACASRPFKSDFQSGEGAHALGHDLVAFTQYSYALSRDVGIPRLALLVACSVMVPALFVADAEIAFLLRSDQ